MREHHGHNLRNSGAYRSFHAAKRRCKFNPDYVGRGIEFKFNSFGEFFTLLGQRPAGMTLERIKNDGHYESGNVRWATRKDQQNNRRPKGSNVLTHEQLVEIRNSKESQNALAAKYHVNQCFISRIQTGKRLEKL